MTFEFGEITGNELVIKFFKRLNLYNDDFFEKIRKNTKTYDMPYEEIKDFVGCFPIYDKENKIIDFKLILPSIKSIEDVLIYIHEYSHALFLEDESEIFPNMMEALFINDYLNLDTKRNIIEKLKQDIETEESKAHIIGRKVKLLNIKVI